MSNDNNNRPRRYKCKQCEFIASSKNEFWIHRPIHIKREKQLCCPNCPFVTEFKHHLEYHLRNHLNSKPFTCSHPNCTYSCVNKSMLNSHLKSHSNVYQFQCKNCPYVTKYCHSLKVHLRKHNHAPSAVLNLDGTINPYPIIDVYGTRRGPRPKRKPSSSVSISSPASSSTSPRLPTPPLPPRKPSPAPLSLSFRQPSSAVTPSSASTSPQIAINRESNSPNSKTIKSYTPPLQNVLLGTPFLCFPLIPKSLIPSHLERAESLSDDGPLDLTRAKL
ncbi:protein hunchback-like [Tetranychus urticae]|uniref:Protein hunchback n=1 Tax=Tetranychus urticae TaxID=32264 RepID=T1KU53_TETUR|nr:protein hunchback-like [Tetranychus urticae]